MTARDSAMLRQAPEPPASSGDYSARKDVVPAASAQASSFAAASIHILVVDDDAAARSAMDMLLRSAGFVTSTAPDGEAALNKARDVLPDLVLTDLQMPLLDGVELCQRLHEIDSELPIIVMSAHSSMQSVIHSLRAGAEDYLVKPLECDAVLWCVERALTRRAEKRERAELQRALNERLVLSSLREKQHAEAAERHSAQLSALLENLKEGVVIAEPSGRIMMINDAARGILGIREDGPAVLEAFQAHCALDVRGRPLGREQRPLLRALGGEQFLDYEVLHVRPNGDRRRVLTTGTSVRDDTGKVALAVVVFRDVTELRLLEQQHEEYLALVSHDLRNPLSCISMCIATLSQCLEKNPQTEASSSALPLKCVERADRNIARMNLMLEELTASTSLEAAAVEPREACDLRELLANVVDSLDDIRAERVRIQTDEAPSYEVLGISAQLERVIVNLLTNALKYSAASSPVHLRLARRRSDIELEVVDGGIGLAPESVHMIFTKYYRTSDGQTHASGLGLGLYIAQRIVEAHGGRIEVSSEVGTGSTFRLILPGR